MLWVSQALPKLYSCIVNFWFSQSPWIIHAGYTWGSMFKIPLKTYLNFPLDHALRRYPSGITTFYDRGAAYRANLTLNQRETLWDHEFVIISEDIPKPVPLDWKPMELWLIKLLKTTIYLTILNNEIHVMLTQVPFRCVVKVSISSQPYRKYNRL